MSSRWSWFILFLCTVGLTIILVLVHLEDIAAELHISDFMKNGAFTDGVLVQELSRSSGAVHFLGEYEAGGLKYEFILSDSESKLKLYDAVTIIYDRKQPRDYIIESRYQNSGLPLGLFILVFIVFLGLGPLYYFIKIGYLEDKGKRILCVPIKFKWRWWVGSYTYTVVCSIPGDDNKIYKGTCRAPFKALMEDNYYNLKNIPLYISRNHKNLYYVHCEEVSKIVKNGSYNGHTIEELKGL